ncbi:unnamed protein product, partial [Candidula unifasciata]
FSVGCPSLSIVRAQHPAPDLKGQAVVNGQFKEIQLSDYKGKYLVSLLLHSFRAINTEVIGVSTDSHFSHLAWINTSRKKGGLEGLHYPLLSDFNKTISRDYGVLVEDEGIALTVLFLIDTNGIIRHITINDLPVGRCVDEVIRVVQAFQFFEAHGELVNFIIKTLLWFFAVRRQDLTSMDIRNLSSWKQSIAYHSSLSVGTLIC